MRYGSSDGLMRFSLMEGQARALLMDSTRLCDAARATHALSRVATAALGRLLTICCMMSASLKQEAGSITATLRGGGPIGMVTAVGKPNGFVKGYVGNPFCDLPRRSDGKLPVGAAVGQSGDLTVIRDTGSGEPYTGKTRLVSGEVAEDFARYFAVSEQMPSVVSLGVLTGDFVLSAGGLLVQMMPGAGEAAIQSVEMSVGMWGDISRVIGEHGLDDAAGQLLGHLAPELLERSEPRYQCDCSRERVERALISLGQNELLSMSEEPDGAEVVCPFCSRKRRFPPAELRALLREAIL